MAYYNTVDYWNERYSRDAEPFDWYQKYDALRDIIQRQIPFGGSVLIVGCGTATLSADMFNDGYKNILNIDWSRTCIELMTQRYGATLKGMKWSTQQASQISVPSQTVDGIIDKGMLDAILCGDGAIEQAQKVLAEMSRTLKSGGTYVLVSHAGPGQRLSLLQNESFGWSVSVDTVSKPALLEAGMLPPGTAGLDEDPDNPAVHYVYACRKH